MTVPISARNEGDARPLVASIWTRVRRHRSGPLLTHSLLLAGILLASNVHADTPPTLSPATTPAEANLLDIRSLVPDIAEDIEYAGSDNFVGRPVAGYQAAKCLLLKPAATALARVEENLRQHHLRLKLFDCYRPAQAVADFVRWAHDLSDQRSKAAHYPLLDKRELLGAYIASVSGHSRGATVDLTMMQCDTHGSHCQPLDMGTQFDYFGTLAHTDAAAITGAQHSNRLRLRAAMQRAGFSNYPLEWWHYTLEPEPTPHTIYNVLIK
ncbi:MAG: M15 family metallopeptidase [Rhodanobacter sp.]